MGVAVGPAVFVGVAEVGVLLGPPGVTVGPEILTSTHQGLFACAPMPNNAPLAFLNIQYPRYDPAAEGAIIGTEMSMVCPTSTARENAAAVGAPICSPLKNTIWYEVAHAHEPTFFNRHVLVKV